MLDPETEARFKALEARIAKLEGKKERPAKSVLESKTDRILTERRALREKFNDTGHLDAFFGEA